MASTWAWMTATVAAREYPSTICMASGTAVIKTVMTPHPDRAPRDGRDKEVAANYDAQRTSAPGCFFLGRRGHRPQGKEGGSAK